MRLTYLFFSICLLLPGHAEARLTCDSADYAVRLLAAHQAAYTAKNGWDDSLQDVTDLLDSRPDPITTVSGFPTGPTDRTAVFSLISVLRAVNSLAGAGSDSAVKSFLQTQSVRSTVRQVADAVIRSRCAPDLIPLDPVRQVLSEGIVSKTARASENFAKPQTSLPKLKSIVPIPILNIALALLACLVIAPFAYRRLIVRQAEKRKRAKRYNLSLLTDVLAGRSRFSGRVLDINCMGLKLSHGGDLPDSATLSILLLGDWHRARIVWTNSHYAGAIFAKPLRLHQVMTIVAQQRKPGRRAYGKRKTAPN